MKTQTYFTGESRLKYDIFRKAVGARLQSARRRTGMSVAKVSATTGLSQKFIKRMELGHLDANRKWCEIFHLYVLADNYMVSITHLLGEERAHGIDNTLTRKLSAIPPKMRSHITGLINELVLNMSRSKEIIVHVDGRTAEETGNVDGVCDQQSQDQCPTGV